METNYCKVEAHETSKLIKGYCKKHYQRMAKGQDPFQPSRYDDRPAMVEGNLARIPVGVRAKNGYALVDKSDSQIDKHKWSITGNGYASTSHQGNLIGMHVMIMGKVKGKEIDHINRNKLDNRRSNLRHVTRSQNIINAPLRTNNTSGHKNIYWNKRKNGWAININRNYKKYSKGYFKDIKEAIKVKEQMLRELSWTN